MEEVGLEMILAKPSKQKCNHPASSGGQLTCHTKRESIASEQ